MGEGVELTAFEEAVYALQEASFTYGKAWEDGDKVERKMRIVQTCLSSVFALHGNALNEQRAKVYAEIATAAGIRSFDNAEM